MKQGEAVYLQYRQMLIEKQWGYLIAIAKEGSVQQITANDFLKNHKIGTPSVSRRLARMIRILTSTAVSDLSTLLSIPMPLRVNT